MTTVMNSEKSLIMPAFLIRLCRIVLQGPMSFSLNLMEHSMEDVKKCTHFFKKYIEQYKQDCAITSEMWPNSYAFEELRLKRYSKQ